jgi:hypothetical protein
MALLWECPVGNLDWEMLSRHSCRIDQRPGLFEGGVLEELSNQDFGPSMELKSFFERSHMLKLFGNVAGLIWMGKLSGEGKTERKK